VGFLRGSNVLALARLDSVIGPASIIKSGGKSQIGPSGITKWEISPPELPRVIPYIEASEGEIVTRDPVTLGAVYLLSLSKKINRKDSSEKQKER